MIRAIAIALLLTTSAAFAQPISQTGQVTPGHAVQWTTNGVVQDAGTAASGSLTGIGTTAQGPSICANSGPITSLYNSICLGVTPSGGGTISLNNYNGATGGLSFTVNGVAQGLPIIQLPVTINDQVCVATSAGNLKDCGPIGGVTVGSSSVNSGTSGYVLFDNGGVLGNYPITGTAGSVVLSGGPTFTGTMTLPDGSTWSSTGINFLAGIGVGERAPGAGNVNISGQYQVAGSQIAASNLSNGVTGSGNVVLKTSPTIANPTFTGSVIASGLITNSDLQNNSMNINGTTCTLGPTLCSPSSSATAITVGTTQFNSGTPGYIAYNNAGILGNLPTTGSAGSVALSISPNFTGTIGAVNITLSGNLVSGSTTENFPTSGNIVGTTDAQAVTNKTINSTLNTITNVAIGTSVIGTLNAIYKGQGSSAMTATALTDDGSFVYTSSPLDLTNQSLIVEIANAGSTGTTVNKLAKLTGAPSTAVIAATTDTQAIVGVVVGGAGTSGSAQIAIEGQATCVFDGATTAGDYVQASSGTAGDCSDIGATYPGSGQALGRVLSTHGGAGTYGVLIFPPEIRGGSGGGSGTVTSVAVVAGSFINKSGTCSSSSAINCTVASAFLGGALASIAGAL